MSEQLEQMSSERKRLYKEVTLQFERSFTGDTVEAIVTMLIDARQRGFEEAKSIALTVAKTAPFRAHNIDDRDFHSGCVQTRERIVDALERALERKP